MTILKEKKYTRHIKQHNSDTYNKRGEGKKLHPFSNLLFSFLTKQQR